MNALLSMTRETLTASRRPDPGRATLSLSAGEPDRISSITCAVFSKLFAFVVPVIVEWCRAVRPVQVIDRHLASLYGIDIHFLCCDSTQSIKPAHGIPATQGNPAPHEFQPQFLQAKYPKAKKGQAPCNTDCEPCIRQAARCTLAMTKTGCTIEPAFINLHRALLHQKAPHAPVMGPVEYETHKTNARRHQVSSFCFRFVIDSMEDRIGLRLHAILSADQSAWLWRARAPNINARRHQLSFRFDFVGRLIMKGIGAVRDCVTAPPQVHVEGTA